MINSWTRALPVVVCLMLLTPGLAAADDDEEQPFSRGSFTTSILLGAQSNFDETYFVVGGGLGYFIWHGLELSGQFAHWFGGTPRVTVVSPGVRYIVPLAYSLRPYVGTFYRHWFVGSGFSDVDTVGFRGGLVYARGRGVVLGGGLVYERILSDCTDCDDFYPEVTIGFLF